MLHTYITVALIYSLMHACMHVATKTLQEILCIHVYKQFAYISMRTCSNTNRGCAGIHSLRSEDNNNSYLPAILCII